MNNWSARIDEAFANNMPIADLLEVVFQEGRASAVKEVEEAMYHQCFECNNAEDMQKWDSGNWLRYKLFENVMNQLKEQNNGIQR